MKKGSEVYVPTIHVSFWKPSQMSKVDKSVKITSFSHLLTDWADFWCKWKVLRSRRPWRWNFWVFSKEAIVRRLFVKKCLFFHGFSIHSSHIWKKKKIFFWFKFVGVRYVFFEFWDFLWRVIERGIIGQKALIFFSVHTRPYKMTSKIQRDRWNRGYFTEVAP